jgi:hypothetical protein
VKVVLPERVGGNKDGLVRWQRLQTFRACGLITGVVEAARAEFRPAKANGTGLTPACSPVAEASAVNALFLRRHLVQIRGEPTPAGTNLEAQFFQSTRRLERRSHIDAASSSACDPGGGSW